MLPYDSISQAIEARHLITSLEGAVCIPAGASARVVLDALEPNNFDQAPVVEGGEVVGFVTREAAASADPGAPVSYHPLTSPFLVSARAPVATVLQRLQTASIVFAVDATGLVGFVTPSDMSKQPVRTHFYLLLADLEMTIAARSRGWFSDPIDALRLLSVGRRQKALERYESAKSFNIDADVLSAFEFSDLLTIVGRTPLRNRFGYSSRAAWERATSDLTDFRDHVMHPTSEFLGKREITDLVAIETKLRQMLITASEASA